MATYQQRGRRWRAIVRKRGHSLSKSFDSKADARAWAGGVEAEIARDSFSDVRPLKDRIQICDRSPCTIVRSGMPHLIEFAKAGDRAAARRVCGFTAQCLKRGQTLEPTLLEWLVAGLEAGGRRASVDRALYLARGRGKETLWKRNQFLCGIVQLYINAGACNHVAKGGAFQLAADNWRDHMWGDDLTPERVRAIWQKYHELYGLEGWPWE